MLSTALFMIFYFSRRSTSLGFASSTLALAIELADLYPGATVISNDLGPIQLTPNRPSMTLSTIDTWLDPLKTSHDGLKQASNKIGRTIDPAPSFKQ
ncbi:hypothetical protein TPAR_07274 [Tolypocladium paradoxum]|uniref:Uncharacterized protein n=1 Tax=Tolypocladium paradoxum TaxID=94208 RepID=A0A2S4KQP9_9HYPO|nr:hypothetical protein TPAR_07274 [Tolypocladium paradoxum]